MADTEILNDDDIQKFLDEYPGWRREDAGLARDFKFKNFREAFAFLTQVALWAEKRNHHPGIYNSYNKVTIMELCTHDMNDQITTRDIDLAQKISKLYD